MRSSELSATARAAFPPGDAVSPEFQPNACPRELRTHPTRNGKSFSRFIAKPAFPCMRPWTPIAPIATRLMTILEAQVVWREFLVRQSAGAGPENSLALRTPCGRMYWKRTGRRCAPTSPETFHMQASGACSKAARKPCSRWRRSSKVAAQLAPQVAGLRFTALAAWGNHGWRSNTL